MNYFNPPWEALQDMKVCLRTTSIVPLKTTPATAQNESGKMWMAFMKEAEKYDNREVEAWKGNSDGILVFVRPTLLVLPFRTIE